MGRTDCTWAAPVVVNVVLPTRHTKPVRVDNKLRVYLAPNGNHHEYTLRCMLTFWGFHLLQKWSISCAHRPNLDSWLSLINGKLVFQRLTRSRNVLPQILLMFLFHSVSCILLRAVKPHVTDPTINVPQAGRHLLTLARLRFSAGMTGLFIRVV